MITHLGDINLGEVRAVNGVSKRSGFSFATHDKPLNKPSKQRLGGELDEWRITFELNHHFCEPQATLEQLENACQKGEPLPLVFDYVRYNGWVTLDTLDISYRHLAPNGKPLVITGTLTLSEFTGKTTPKPPAPAVREQSKRADMPVPIQTAVTDDVNELLPTRQPMQHLEDALIAQHRARALLRNIDNLGDGDISSLNDSINMVNRYFTSDKALLNTEPLPAFDVHNPQLLINAMDKKTVFFAELGRGIATRIF